MYLLKYNLYRKKLKNILINEFKYNYIVQYLPISLHIMHNTHLYRIGIFNSFFFNLLYLFYLYAPHININFAPAEFYFTALSLPVNIYKQIYIKQSLL